MILDTNLLVDAVRESSPQHERARQWMEQALTGPERVGLPWQTIGSFVRIVTNARIVRPTFSGPDAWSFVEEWLASPVVWVPPVGERTVSILGTLIRTHRLTGNLIPDAQLAALAIEYGVAVASADTDFARFPEVRWINPLA